MCTLGGEKRATMEEWDSDSMYRMERDREIL